MADILITSEMAAMLYQLYSESVLFFEEHLHALAGN